MGLYFQNKSSSSSNAGEFVSPFIWFDESIKEGRPILVQLTHHGIEFYFDYYDEKHSVSPHQSRVLLYIPIGDPQKTGYTLLNIKDPKGVLKTRGNLAGYRLHYGDVINNRKILEVPGFSAGHTFFELLLCFFDDLNNHDSDLNKYSHKLAAYTRDKLNNCEVYELIQKKYSFYNDVKDYLESDKHIEKKKDLRVTYHIFLDEILKGKIEKWVPGYCMRKNNWFSTPEEEMEDLAGFDRIFGIDSDRFEDIQKALLAKHDVIKAMKLNTSSLFFPFITNIIAAFLYFGVFIYWLTNHYNTSFWILCAAFWLFFLGMIIHAIQQRLKLSMFLPRIIVSIATAWFILIASEEILKNQINTNKLTIIIGIPLIMMLLFVFIFAEIRQHSPYYVYSKNSRLYGKTLLIIIYSFNFTISLGFILHPLIVDNYIKKSSVYENYIFGNSRDSLIRAKGEWEGYRNKLLAAQSSNMVAFSMIPTSELRSFLSYNDSIRRFSVSGNSITRDSKDSLILIFIQTYNNKMQSLERVDSVLANEIISHSFPKVELKQISIQNLTKNNYLTSLAIPLSNNELKISDAINTCDTILENIGKKILLVNNIDTLVGYTTIKEGDTIKPGYKIGQYGLQRYSTKVLRYETTIPFLPIKPVIIYPFLLIFQTLVVLLFAIIGQLIISDKTITESL